MAGATSRPRSRSPRPLADAVSARRSRRRWCFALCVVRCPTWFQPAACSFYGHFVSSSSGDDCVCACALHPLTRARCSDVVHVGCARRRFRSAAARCAVESPAGVHEDTSPARASRRVRVRAALCAIGTALRHCRSGGRSAARWLRGVATCRVVTCPHTSEADSRARSRRPFRLSTDARDVCSGAW